MAKIVVTAQVKDPVKWEESFRTHGDLFKRQKLTKPIDFGVSANQVAVCFETDDLGNLQSILQSPETADAMDVDGVLRDTVNIYVLDKNYKA
ncbi:MAG: hypothetical protein JO177_05755 [Candidatus Eremiobacteraeota bacterium]|nr:hypothetical protein [Candidatus Eremiobacteraeota bacterium]